MPVKFVIHIWALAAEAPIVSGGDKIFMECARHWAATHRVILHTSQRGAEMCHQHGLQHVEIHTLPVARFRALGLAAYYIAGVVLGCLHALRLRFDADDRHVIYSASDFWPDVLPALTLRLRWKTARWVAGFFFLAPSPFGKAAEAEYRGGSQPVSLRSLLYFFTQRMVYPLMKRWADFWVVANQLDRDLLEKDGIPQSRTLALYGGVDVREIAATPADVKISYDACFVGRLHVQKGVQWLIPIWEEVLKSLPDARLAIIGDGPLRAEIESFTSGKKLSERIRMLGYVDGVAKYAVLKSSRVFLHTPLWDTGGMAAAEGMACGLPVVAFDLPGYRHCYPRGMVMAKREDASAFASLVVQLLKDDVFYSAQRKEALDFAQSWDWGLRAKSIEQVFPTLFP